MQVKYSNSDRWGVADIVVCNAVAKLWGGVSNRDFHKTINDSHGHVYGHITGGNGVVEITTWNYDSWRHNMYVTFDTPEDYLQFQLTHG